MGQSMGTLDFFLLEGGEYLERLDALAQTPAGTFAQGDELVRCARAFRGSAIMASQHGMARAALSIDSCARAVREGRLGWTEAIRGEFIRAIDDSKILMRRLRSPEQGDTEKAEAIGAQLDRLSGRASAAMRAHAGPGLDAGARAFVAREAAAIASVLQRVARTLRADPGNRDVLASISPAMSALRGVAVLNDLPPLGDILAALEHAARDVMASAGAMGADAAEVFDAGGRALARAAREVVDTGRPDAEAEESHAFTSRLFTALTGGNVVSIESLFYGDAGPHIVTQGTPPQAVAPGLDRVEMVSHGEYLTAAAAELGKVGTPVQRDLRLYGIAASLRQMMGSDGSPLATALGRLAEAARDAIGRGAASRSIQDFIAGIAQAANALAGAQSGDEQTLAARIGAASDALVALTARSRTKFMPQTQEEEPAAAAAPGHRGTGAPVLGDADLATSYLTFEQLIAERGLPMGSLEELVAGGASAAAAEPSVSGRPTPARNAALMDPRHTPPMMAAVSKPAPAEPPVVPIESLAPDDSDVVPIESLLYRGDAALRRALALKPEVEAAVQSGGGSAQLRALLDEVLDLVELGAGTGR
jgi:hypothetical protein